VIDRTGDHPRTGLLGERLTPILRAAADGRVVCVLNRKGRVRLLACRVCGRLTVCETCAGPMEHPDADGPLSCRRCRRERPPLCQACGSGALRSVRAGVSKVRGDLEALARVPVGEVTAETDGVPDTPILVGTEAVLRRVDSAAAVVFLDFDAELLAPRLRAAEDALALLAAAARVVGGRQGGRVAIQTRQPTHHVVAAAVHADPDRAVAPELEVRRQLGLPPFSALAAISGEATVTADLASTLGATGLEVSPADRGRWIVRAPDHQTLCDALARAGRPAGVSNAALRIDVDPHDV
jgi:primosomal protein N' (replication factor Y)